MLHRFHLALLGVIIAVASVGIIFMSSFQLTTDPSGYFRIATRSEPQADVCFDTDGGANQFVRGATSYLNWSFIDDCSIVENASILYESYCISPTQPAIVQFNCTAGCQDGACIR